MVHPVLHHPLRFNIFRQAHELSGTPQGFKRLLLLKRLLPVLVDSYVRGLDVPSLRGSKTVGVVRSMGHGHVKVVGWIAFYHHGSQLLLGTFVSQGGTVEQVFAGRWQAWLLVERLNGSGLVTRHLKRSKLGEVGPLLTVVHPALCVVVL